MDYDLAIIGAGWAGFNAALRAKAKGLKTCLIERGQIGGTCLNLGCIPTKALLQSAKIYSLAKKSKVFGIDTASPVLNFTEIQSRKNKIIQQLRKGMEPMLKGVDFINLEARILSSHALETKEGKINTKFILLATGSRPMELKNLKLDGKKIISSNEILDIQEVPRSLLIVGGGVIGCEFASLFSSLGCQVCIVELTHQILPGVDKEIARKIETIFKKRSIKINTNTDAATINFSDYELVLLCVGRTAATSGLDLDRVNVKLERGRVITDEYLKTNIPNIYAAGDCTSKIMLAHLAGYQGNIAVDNILDPSHPKRADNSNIPSCIFTDPEIGVVGLTPEETQSMDRQIKINRFDFLGLAMARILDETEGFIKIISDKETGEVLGGSVIGPKATELIGILTLAVQSHLKISELKDSIFAHPTLSEGITGALKEEHGI